MISILTKGIPKNRKMDTRSTPPGPLNPRAIAQIAAAVAGASTRKVDKFASGDGPAFLAWQVIFKIDCDINGWRGDELRMKQELRGAMLPPASAAIADISYEDSCTMEEMLKKYTERFMPVAASRLAKVQFSTSRQEETESTLLWFGRVRELFERA